MSTAKSLEKELAVGIAAVRAAAQLCRSVQQDLAGTALEKNDRSPVTVADFGSQALICQALHAAFPHDAIMAEEDAAALREASNHKILHSVLSQLQQASSQRAAIDVDGLCALIDRGRTRSFCERFWTLDPIDGTKGFLRGEQDAIALALIVDGQVDAAILGCPNLTPGGALFFARRGGGAFVLPIDGSENSMDSATAIHVSSQDDAAQARFCESVEAAHSAHGDAEKLAQRLGITRPGVRLDSQAKYALVANGEAEVYLRLPTRKDYREKLWDHAAGFLIVSEAGGKVTDIDGKPLAFQHGAELSQNRGVIASNGLLHERILAALRQI